MYNGDGITHQKTLPVCLCANTIHQKTPGLSVQMHCTQTDGRFVRLDVIHTNIHSRL